MGVKNLDEALQMVHRAIRDKAIKWNDFRPVGVEDDYHDWYYAENRLYVIHDRILDNIVLYQGKSPKDAYESWQMDIEDIWEITMRWNDMGVYIEHLFLETGFPAWLILSLGIIAIFIDYWEDLTK